MDCNRIQNVEQAILSFQFLVNIYKARKREKEWAISQKNLGIACYEYAYIIANKNPELVSRAFEGRTWTHNILIVLDSRAIEESIKALKSALTVLNSVEFEQDWIETQQYLGAAYQELMQEDPTDNLQKALKIYKLSLDLSVVDTGSSIFSDFNRQISEMYETTMNSITDPNQADVDFSQLLDPSPENLDIETNIDNVPSEVLEGVQLPDDLIELAPIHTKEWAMVQVRVGKLYSDERLNGDRSENIEQAISAYQQALTVFTLEQFPKEWAFTQSLLGIAYYHRLQPDRFQENLKQAIAAFKQALTVLSFPNYPEEWLATQNNLGIAYSLPNVRL